MCKNSGSKRFLLPLFFCTTEAHLTQADSPSSDQFHVVTVSDTGRNWSDQEVQALIQVWSDERVCKQLESSTRKRDIFVQISNRLMQQGIERDWKQCHTKYKNLKYLYRSLQRSKTDEAERKRLMRFYDEVDAIMTHAPNGSLRGRGAADASHSGPLPVLQICEENHRVDVCLAKSSRGVAVEEKTCHSDSGLLTDDNDDLRLREIREHQSDQHHNPKSELVIICLNTINRPVVL